MTPTRFVCYRGTLWHGHDLPRPGTAELTYDEELDWWEGQISLWNRPADVYLWAEDDLNDDRTVRDTVAATVRALQNAQHSIILTTAEGLHRTFALQTPLGASAGLDTDGIAGFLVLSSVELYPDGGALLSFPAADLGGDHVVLCRTDAEARVTAVTVAG